jgi:hypothetical protein
MANKFDLQRLHQLEMLLRWEGQLGNARLRELFGFTSVRASQCLKDFREFHPDWTQWNSLSKTFNATPEFYNSKGTKDSESLSQYLSLVGLPSAAGSENQHVVVSAFPDIATPNPQYFATLSNAARLGRDVEVTYSSMSEPAPHKRIISPHSIVRAGPRWHVRAYSKLNKQFRDYTLGRISGVKLLDQPSEFSIKDDKDWMTEVEVRITAHPDLTIEQESLIRFEYFGNTAARVTTCRGPLVNYFIKEVGAAIDVENQHPPEYFLAVQNVKEVSKWLFTK